MASEYPRDPVDRPPGGMAGRIKRLLTTPGREWAAIDREPMRATTIFTRWVVPLAAIGPIAGLIGGQLFGSNFWFVHFRPSLSTAIGTAALGYAAALVGIWVLALVIDALAPNFGSTRNRDQAMKAAAFSCTAAWVAGVLNIIPALAAIAMLLSLYSLYLLWVGLPLVMKTPTEKAAGYVVVSVVVAIVVQIIINVIVGSIAAMLFVTTPFNQIVPDGTVQIGDSSFDAGQINAAGVRIERTAKAIANGGSGKTVSGDAVKTVDPGALQAMLPGAIGGWRRTSVESQGGGAVGISGAKAEARYASGAKEFALSVTDMGALGNLATLGGAINATSSRQTETGYEKTEMRNGNMVSEKWDARSASGSYSVMVASRFLVEAEGDAPGVDTLKSAVGSVDLGRLQSLAR